MIPVILAMVVGGFSGLAYASVFAEREYESVSKAYVLSRSGEDDSFTAYDLQAGGLLTRDYEQILTGMETARRVIGRLHLTDEKGQLMAYEDFIGHIRIDTMDDTRVVTVRVQNRDPYAACDIADALHDEAIDQLQAVVNEDVVTRLQRANIPLRPAAPILFLSVFAGIFAGGGAAAAGILILLLISGGHALEPERFRLRRNITAALTAAAAGLVILCSLGRQGRDLIGPEIVVPEERISYQEGRDPEFLLEGVTASDDVDGDCTASVRISGIYPGENGICTIVYVARDKSMNVTAAERQADYVSDR